MLYWIQNSGPILLEGSGADGRVFLALCPKGAQAKGDY